MKNKIDILKNTFNSVIDDFLKNPDIIYNSESEKNKIFYNLLKTKQKKWETAHNCIFLKCKRKSIVRSHSISRSSSLKSISENGHVFTPVVGDGGILEMKEKGINKASTFPGFCEKHEQLFQDFENKKKLTDEKHFYLQIYRTICREYFVKKYYLDNLNRLRKEYIENRDKKLMKLVFNRLQKKGINTDEFKASKIEFSKFDDKEELVNNKINSLKKDLAIFEKNYYIALSEEILNKEINSLSVRVIDCDVFIPVCLAGRGNFHVNQDSKTYNVIVIFNVLPYKDRTHIILCCKKNDVPLLDNYLSRYKNPLYVINMLESWMIHGSDNWYIKPSVWNAINKKYQNKILDDILKTDKNIGSFYDLTIFNQLKRHIISFAKKPYQEWLENLIEKEKNKFTDT